MSDGEHEGSLKHRKHLKIAREDLEKILDEARYLRDRFTEGAESQRSLSVDATLLVNHIEALVTFTDPDKTPDPSEAGVVAQTAFEGTRVFQIPEPPDYQLPAPGNYRPPKKR